MVLLAILRVGGDAYGVPIARELEESSGKDVPLGSVYAALDRLEGERPASPLRSAIPRLSAAAAPRSTSRSPRRRVREIRDTQQTLTSLSRGLPALRGKPA